MEINHEPYAPPETTIPASTEIETLRQKAIAGEPYAIEDFLGAISPTIWRLVRSRNGQGDDDTAQQVLIKAYRYMVQPDPQTGQTAYRGEGHISWLHTAIVSTTIDEQRKSMAMKYARVQAYDLTDELESTATENNAEQTVEQNETRARLIEMLAQSGCNGRQMAAVIGLHYEGLTVKELAESLNVREGTVKSAAYRGRELIRNYLNTRGVNTVTDALNLI